MYATSASGTKRTESDESPLAVNRIRGNPPMPEFYRMAQRGNRRGLTRRRGPDHYIWYASQLRQAQHVALRAAAGQFGRIGVLRDYV